MELARRDILSEAEMAAIRPDVAYSILELDVLKEEEPARPGRALADVMGRIAAGELTPLVHTRWPLAEAGAAMAFMRDAPAHRQDRADRAAAPGGPAAAGPDLPRGPEGSAGSGARWRVGSRTTARGPSC